MESSQCNEVTPCFSEDVFIRRGGGGGKDSGVLTSSFPYPYFPFPPLCWCPPLCAVPIAKYYGILYCKLSPFLLKILLSTIYFPAPFSLGYLYLYPHLPHQRVQDALLWFSGKNDNPVNNSTQLKKKQ